MTLLLDAVVVVGGIAIGRWIAGRVRADRVSRGTVGQGTGGVRAAAVDPFVGLPCKLGDVVLRVVERDEAWLAGALVLLEDQPVAALFVAPEAGGDRALFVRRAEGAGIAWLSPLPEGSLVVGNDPPHALEHDGTRYERVRRLPVRVSRVGTGAPSVGERAIVAEYAAGPKNRLLVMAGTDLTLAWQGTFLAEGEYDVLPGEAPS